MNVRPLLTLAALAAVSTPGTMEDLAREIRSFVNREPTTSVLGTVAGAAYLFYRAEVGKNPKVKSYYDALIYVSTCLSVGYGDIFAHTDAGKLIGTALMTYGPALSGKILDEPVASCSPRLMAPKTSVEKDRVTIDGVVYLVAGAGAQQWSVSDEFGEKLGYFTVRGRAVTPEDYRLTGAPPVIQIAKLWVAANLSHDDKPAAPVSKGVCQISVSEGATDADLEAARARRAWLKKQPGMKASYLVRDPATGKATTIAIWQTRAQLDAAEAAAGAEGAPLATTSVEVFPFVEEP